MEPNFDKINSGKKEKETFYFLVEATIPDAVSKKRKLTVIRPMAAVDEKSAEFQVYLSLRSDFSSFKEEIERDKIVAKKVSEAKYWETITRAEESREAYDTVIKQ